MHTGRNGEPCLYRPAGLYIPLVATKVVRGTYIANLGQFKAERNGDVSLSLSLAAVLFHSSFLFFFFIEISTPKVLR